MNIKFMCRSTW